MKKFHFGLLALSAVVLILMVAGPARPDDDSGPVRLTLTGALELNGFIAELSKQFAAFRPDSAVRFSNREQADPVSQVRGGDADTALVPDGRTLSPDLASVGVAIEGFCILVQRSNHIANLSLDQLDQIYTGRITNWKQLGGEDGPILTVGNTAAIGGQNLFTQMAKIAPGAYRASINANTPQDLMAGVYQNTQSIGYAPLTALNYLEGVKIPIRVIAVEGIDPTPENLRSGKYPAARKLMLLARQPTTAGFKVFADFLRGDKARGALRISNLIHIPG